MADSWEELRTFVCPSGLPRLITQEQAEEIRTANEPYRLGRTFGLNDGSTHAILHNRTYRTNHAPLTRAYTHTPPPPDIAACTAAHDAAHARFLARWNSQPHPEYERYAAAYRAEQEGATE